MVGRCSSQRIKDLAFFYALTGFLIVLGVAILLLTPVFDEPDFTPKIHEGVIYSDEDCATNPQGCVRIGE